MPNGDTITGLKDVAEKISRAGAGDIQIVDAGDVEVIKFGEDIIATLPKGKDVWFINRNKFPTIPTDVRKLSEVAD